MFETHAAPTGFARRMPFSTAFSVGAHGLLVAMVVVLGAVKARQAADKEVNVNFIGPGKGAKPPPPPPPPAAKKRTSVKRVKIETPKRVIEIPKTVVLARLDPPKIVEEPPKEEPEEADDGDDAGEVGGVEGGVKGGVAGGTIGGTVGGVIGGTLGGTGGGGTALPPARPKAKNVPEFVVKKSVIRQPMPRLSEMFKAANRGKTGIGGLYKVCVDLDGKVYEVIPVKGVPGADDSIIDGIKDYWLFQPQTTPICFLYNMQITVQ